MNITTGEWIIIGLLIGAPVVGIVYGIIRYFVFGIIGAIAHRIERAVMKDTYDD